MIFRALILVGLLHLDLISAQFCQCDSVHPQDILCKAAFVGIIRISRHEIPSLNDSTDETYSPARAEMITIYKGRYQDFDEGEHVNIYTPAKQGDCAMELEEGYQLVSGRPYHGGLLIRNCDLRQQKDFFTEGQLVAIKSHLRNRAYSKGCESCRIKQLYDYSFIYADECRPVYEFPVHTSACVPSDDEGMCEWVKESQIPFKWGWPAEGVKKIGKVPSVPGSPSPKKTTSRNLTVQDAPKKNVKLVNNLNNAEVTTTSMAKSETDKVKSTGGVVKPSKSTLEVNNLTTTKSETAQPVTMPQIVMETRMQADQAAPSWRRRFTTVESITTTGSTNSNTEPQTTSKSTVTKSPKATTERTTSYEPTTKSNPAVVETTTENATNRPLTTEIAIVVQPTAEITNAMPTTEKSTTKVVTTNTEISTKLLPTTNKVITTVLPTETEQTTIKVPKTTQATTTSLPTTTTTERTTVKPTREMSTTMEPTTTKIPSSTTKTTEQAIISLPTTINKKTTTEKLQTTTTKAKPTTTRKTTPELLARIIEVSSTTEATTTTPKTTTKVNMLDDINMEFDEEHHKMLEDQLPRGSIVKLLMKVVWPDSWKR